MLNGIEEGGISGSCKVKISRYPGCTSNDLVHHAIPSINKNPDVIICHAGTNVLTNDEDTITNLTSIVNRMKRKCPFAKIAISSVITRKDKKELENRAAVLDKELMRFCDDNLIDFISNENIDETCLGKRKLHLNRKGDSYLAVNFIEYLQSLC